MQDYAIYCTSEQKMKALKLGAPLEYIRDNHWTKIYLNPTTEQMIGWLEEQGIFINIDLTCDFKYQSYLKTLKNSDHNIISKVLQHSSRQEATIATIDEALDYLIKAKKETK